VYKKFNKRNVVVAVALIVLCTYNFLEVKVHNYFSRQSDSINSLRCLIVQTKKCWENVTEALKSHGNTKNNYQTIQHQFMDLKAKLMAEWAKKEAKAGVEDFGDDDDPVA